MGLELRNIDLGGLGELQNANFQNLAIAPTTNLRGGRFYYSTVDHTLYVFDGTQWKDALNGGLEYDAGTGIDISGNVISADFNKVVSTSITVNGKPLSSNITLGASDVGALPDDTTIEDLTTTTQLNAINSGATTTNIGQIATNTSAISIINDKIPSQASSSNQLADKDFVNSSISTNTAYFDGSWATYVAIPSTESGFTTAGYPAPTNNNYLVVVEDETQDGGTWRYKYVDDGTAYAKSKWKVEYEVNETPLTAAQLAALNSGATSTNIAQISTIQTTINGYGNIVIHNVNEFATAAQGTKADTAAQTYTTPNPALTVTNNIATWTVTHNLSKVVGIHVYKTSSGEEIGCDKTLTSANVATIEILATGNISAGTYTVVVIGG